MEKTTSFLLVCLLTCVILAACGPSQAELDAQATKVAADVFATQTAEAVVAVPAPTDTPVPLAKPTSTALPEELPTETLVPSPTPEPPTAIPPTDTPLTSPTPEPPTAIPPTDTPLPSPTSEPPTAIPPTDTPLPTATFTSTPEPDFAVDVDVILPETSLLVHDIPALVVGDTLTVTVTVEIIGSVDCGPYEVSLYFDRGRIGPATIPLIYEYVSPSKVNQRGNSITTFTLTMVDDSSYMHQLGAMVSGEHNCDGSAFGTWFMVYPDQPTASLASSTNCVRVPEGGFRTIWQSDPDLQTALGCPTSYHPRISPEAWQVKTSYQPFERGEMIWSDRTGWYGESVIYVLYANSTYQRFADTFDPATDPVSGGETPPHGLVEPILGFGKVWREEPGLREVMGWATADETPGQGRFQMFTRGNMVWINQTDKTYVLIGDIVHVFDVPFSETGWQVYATSSAGFTFRYPEGWMIEQEYYYETLGGEKAEYATVVLRQIRNEDPSDLITINQRQCQCAEGKCAEIGSILIGTYSDNPEILSVFDDIVASFEVH